MVFFVCGGFMCFNLWDFLELHYSNVIEALPQHPSPLPTPTILLLLALGTPVTPYQ